jgi:stearoyl-CoA desaturase (Delta-9 desaturase)
MITGVWDIPWWGYVIYALAVTHITIAAVTIFLHRCQSHRALDLHPAVSHFFRFWLWLSTGMVTKAWAAIHRKHHARVETEEDPHSPQIHGIRKVLWEGAELYRVEARNQETLEKYGAGTPDDWLEHHLYNHDRIGISLLFVVNFVLFGFVGIAIWAVQMAWIPFLAAGVINGIGHYWGYRNFQPEDASTNIVPWGILIGGEELHNNHHAYASSAKFSNRWYEFDLGWLYIRVMEWLGLAQVKKVAPEVKLDAAKTHCDLATVQAVITHRYEVLAKYAKSLRRTCTEEMQSMKARAVRVDFGTIKRMLHSDSNSMPAHARANLDEALGHSKVLATVYHMRQELAVLWQRSSASKEQLLRHLEDWCARAESSGIVALQQFSRRLRCYA